ncbi:MAG: hypothetical protein COZ57_22380 [Armatimonadetes bacterium CG_4_8_14_3_um_filter_66_20]|nr:MAG: hypothetical protein COZ57_22380 [Armatimonadetes bacterium CG_4_8_14_3_um_filter_66_20]
MPRALRPLLCAASLAAIASPLVLCAPDLGTAPDLTRAAWIWSGADPADPTGFVSCFRRKFTLTAEPAEATLAVTADNGFGLWVNNRQVAEEVNYGNAWQSVERFRIERYLTKGANVVAIKGENLGGPGGVLAAFYVRTADGVDLSLVSDPTWLSAVEPEGNWTEPDHDDSLWGPAHVVAPYGGGPWGTLTAPDKLTDASTLVVDRQIPGGVAPLTQDRFAEPEAGFAWPEGIVFLAGRAPEHSTPAQAAKWSIRGSRAFFEYDVPAPAASGYRLYALSPATPDGSPRLLLDAGKGLIASPTCSYDGTEILFCMAPAGEGSFHLYRIGSDGSGLTQLTRGPWHDYDPAELPDGRIVFASTRIGCREEYHANAARSLFVLDRSRDEIRPLTYHIVADTDPEVMADGRIVFVRQDNFLERAKVETHLHCVHPDGTGGEILVGPDRDKIPYDRATAAEDGYAWLRNHGCGSPAPLPDGRVACISELGPTITETSDEGRDIRAMPCDVNPFDMAALPDNRLLVSTLKGLLAIVDPATGTAVRLLETKERDLHSVAYLGARPKPRAMSTIVKTDADRDPGKTGVLFCQSVFNTKQVDGDWRRVKAVRVYSGSPFTLRAAHHQYGHIGTEGVELGTVPLAPDGSFLARVPADRPLALQAVDAEGRAGVNELSWIYVRPGETRSCIGCHAQRQAAPTEKLALAGTRQPVDLTLVPGLPRFRANNAANGGVMNLQLERFREVGSIDLYRQTALPAGSDLTDQPPGRPAAVKALLQHLRDGDPAQRRVAAQRLGLFRDRAAVPGLCAALDDAEVPVRVAAALALAASGNREAVPALLSALRDSACEVAQGANVALEHLTGHAEPFNAYGSEEERTKDAAGWAAWLAAHDWDAIERDLVAQTDSPDATVSHLAIEALGHVGGEPAKAALRKYVESGRSDSLVARLAALRALGHLRDASAVPLLGRVLEENTARTPVQPAKSHEFGWAAMPDHLAGAAAEALGWIGTPEAEQCLLDAFAKLVEFWYYTFRTADHEWLMGCNASIPHYRILESLDALGSRKTAALTAKLLESVPIDTDRGLLFENDSYEVLVSRVVNRSGRAGAVVDTCLAVLGDPQAKRDPALAEAVTASPPAVSVSPLEPESRAAQLLSVVALQPEDALRVRAAFARYHAAEPSRQRSWTCFFLARTLGKLRDAGAVEMLRATLEKDPNEAALGIPDPPNVFLHNAMTPLYRAAAADALGRLGARQAVPALLTTVSDYGNAMDVRQAAANALCAIADPTSLSELTKVADSYPEVITQVTLWEACSATKQAAEGASTAPPR